MRYLLSMLLLFFLWTTCHAEIVTVAVHAADIRSSFSPDLYHVVLEAPRYYPLSVQSERDGYYEVRDYQGRIGWIKKSLVDRTKGVVVEVEKVTVRQGPGAEYPPVFVAYKGVTFKVIEEKPRWLHVSHESGTSGWVFKPLTWGQ